MNSSRIMSNGLIIILSGIILIVVVFLVKAVWHGSSGLPDDELKSNKTSAELVIDQDHNALGLKIPDQVFVYGGQVIEISADFLIVSAKAHSNYLYQDELLKVFYNDETEVVRLGFDPAGGVTRAAIAVGDLAIGDKVTVYSSQNLRQKTAFLASKIELLDI